AARRPSWQWTARPASSTSCTAARAAELFAPRHQPGAHLHLGLHLQEQELRRRQAVVAHVDRLLALELEGAVVERARGRLDVGRAGPPVQLDLPAQAEAAAGRVALLPLADDARVLLRLQPPLQLAVDEAVARLQPLGVDVDAPRRAQRERPVDQLGLDG